jgi:serine O-acetyltransferase
MVSDRQPKHDLPRCIDAIIATYHELPTMQHLGPCPLPSLEAVIGIGEDLKEILFPGYRKRQGLHFGNVTHHVGDLLGDLYDRLAQQIAWALQHEARRRSNGNSAEEPDTDFIALGQDKANRFLQMLPALRKTLATDVQAAYDGDPAAGSLDEIIFCYPGLEAITVYRLAHELLRLGVPLIPRMLSESAHSRTGIDIHPGASIGSAFFIDHGTGVVIGETTDIADHVKIYQGVTLGALSFPKDAQGNLIRNRKRHPTIERGVVIYANATILGGKTVVGANSVIGSGVSLSHSVPPNTKVTMEEPTLQFRQAS